MTRMTAVAPEPQALGAEAAPWTARGEPAGPSQPATDEAPGAPATSARVELVTVSWSAEAERDGGAEAGPVDEPPGRHRDDASRTSAVVGHMLEVPNVQVIGYPTSGAAGSALGRVVGAPGHRSLAPSRLGGEVLAAWARDFEPVDQHLASYEAAALAARTAVVLGDQCYKRKPGITDAQIHAAAIEAADAAVAAGQLAMPYRNPVAALLTLLGTAVDDATSAHIRRAARGAFHRARRRYQVRYRQELLAHNPDWRPRTWANSFFCPLANLTPLDRLDPDHELFDQAAAEAEAHAAEEVWARSGGNRLRLTMWGNLWWATLGCLPCAPANLFLPGWGVGIWACVCLGGNGLCEPRFVTASQQRGCLLLSDGGDRLRHEARAIDKPYFCLPCAGGDCCDRELFLYRST